MISRTVRGTKLTMRPSSLPSWRTLSALRGVWLVHNAALTHSVRRYVTGSNANSDEGTRVVMEGAKAPLGEERASKAIESEAKNGFIVRLYVWCM